MPLNLRTTSEEMLFPILSNEANELRNKCIDLLKRMRYDISSNMVYLKGTSNGSVMLYVGIDCVGNIYPYEKTYPENMFIKLWELCREEAGAWNTGVVVLHNMVFDWFLVTTELYVVSPNYDFSKKVMDFVSIHYYISNEDYTFKGDEITQQVEEYVTSDLIKEKIKGMLWNGGEYNMIYNLIDRELEDFPFNIDNVINMNEKGIHLGLVCTLDGLPEDKRYVRMEIYNYKG